MTRRLQSRTFLVSCAHGGAALLLAFALSGCSVEVVDHSSSGSIHLSGKVHGGQQPVTNSTIELYAVGTSGYGSPSKSLLSSPVTTDSEGQFAITGEYTCESPGEQLYIVASGGNPGLVAGTYNKALVLISVLGDCDHADSLPYIEINEVTTVAAVWASAPFFNQDNGIPFENHIGSSSTNAQGIMNAFRDAQLLADPMTGLAAILPANLTVETSKLYALADALAPCVNSDGITGCVPLFTAAMQIGGSAPTTSLGAALNIVRNPGRNVSGVFGAINTEPPFSGALLVAPNDWTMSLTVIGGGIDSPAALGIDSYNNIWVANAGDENTSSVLSAFDAQGSPYSSMGYGSGSLSQTYGLTIDPCNNVWVGNEVAPEHPNHTFGSITAFVGILPKGAAVCASAGPMGGLLNGRSFVYDDSIDFPVALASDTNGNILIANYANSSATIYSSSEILLTGDIGAGSVAFPLAIAADASHGLWLANQGDNTVTHIAGDGTVTRPTCCNGAEGIAIDALGNAWIANYYGSSVSEVSAAGNTVIMEDTNGGVVDGFPDGIAVDGAQNVWVANFLGNSISELAGNESALTVGTGLSPVAGYGSDADLVQPYGIAPDNSGNIWVTSSANNSLVMFFGIAAPTTTPLTPVPSFP